MREVRVRKLKVDADTGEEVSSDDTMKGHKVDTDSYSEFTKDELENIALDSNRTIDIEMKYATTLDPKAIWATFLPLNPMNFGGIPMIRSKSVGCNEESGPETF